MGTSDYIARLRESVGNDVLLVPSAMACIRDQEDGVLLLRRSDGEELWGFPGGAMEPGERVADAVRREVREEIGLEVEPVTLIGVYSGPEFAFAYPSGDQVQPVSVFLECRVVGGALEPDRDEVLGARYFGPDDDLPLLRPCCAAKARDAFAFDGQAFFR